jgi:amino acid adenylation domain-containing protein
MRESHFRTLALSHFRTAVVVNRKNVEDIYPLSPLQQGMLFHALYSPETGAYVEQWPLLVDGALDVDAFHRAFQRAVDRHAALRTGFVWEGVPQPLQVVMREATLSAERLDWSGAADDAWRARLDDLLAAGRRRGFDLRQAPLARLTFVRLAESRHLLVFAFHHVILDGWSAPLVFGDVEAFYRAERNGTSIHLPPPPKYREYLGWLQRQDAAAHEAFWRASLAGFAEPTPLPLDRGGSDVAEEHAAARLTLDAGETARLQAFAREQALTLNTLVQGAWALLLARHAGTADVLFGATVSGRPGDLPGVERMVGVFINTLPVRVPVPPASTVRAWLAGVQAQQAEMRQHEHARLVDVQGWSDVPRDRPLFGSLVVFENYPLGSDDGEGDPNALHVTALPAVERTNVPLTLVAAPGGDALVLRLNYDTRRFTAASAERLVAQLRAVLAAVAEDADRRVGDVPVFAAGEREQVVAEWNGTATEYPRESTLLALYAEQVRAAPDAVALEFGERRTTYGELDADTDRLARRLRALGVAPDGAVAVAMERSPESIAALLGIVKAGAAYVPLDVSHPAERLSGMLRDCGASALVVPGDVPASLAGWTGPVLSLRGDADAIAAESAGPLGIDVHPENVAYVVFTSGSTGRPKGIAVPHRAVVRLVRGTTYHAFPRGERMGQVVNASFDVLTFEVWGALVNGGTLVGIGRETAMDPAALAQSLASLRIDSAFVTSAVFHQAARDLPDGFRTVRTLMVGGEAVDPAAARAVLRAGGPGRLLNGYGPAENTTYSTWHLIADVAEGDRTVPIGIPVSNSTAYVLDEGMRPLPVGAVGELYVGGDGLARGYAGQAGMTAERFLPDPFGAAGTRLYRTGDRARWTEAGILEFLGRADFQVKIRGYRIEPGEIEAALTALPQVGEAVVIAREDRPGDRRLAAYVAGRGGARPDPAALREALSSTLPEYMVPSAFVVLDTLPLTANGKVDRRALPAPDAEGAQEAYVAPETDTERALAAIWSEVLGVSRIGAEDSFFLLGGHSLMATQVITRVRETLDVVLPLRTLFEAPRLRALAERVDALALAALAAELEGMDEAELDALLAAEPAVESAGGQD